MSRCGECPSWVKEKCDENLAYDECIDMLQDILHELSKSPNGEWRYQFRDSENEEYRCSECNYPQGYKPRFCPNCGAKMKGADDEIN